MIKFPEPSRFSWTENLPGERERITRLCARLTGSYDAAEDLAQETLFEAWRQSGNLREPAAWRGFVTGIARNVCKRHIHRRSLDESRYRPMVEVEIAPWECLPDATDTFDPETCMEREERAELLDRALYALPATTRGLLVEKYVDEMSIEEIAARRDLTESTLGVRIHRARAALRRVLETTPALAEDAAAHGLIPPPGDPNAVVWQKTRIWCPRCGKRYLEARFDRNGDAATETLCKPRFAVRCVGCERALGFDFTTGHPSIDTDRLLHGISGYKPALSRLSAWWADFHRNHAQTRTADCPGCGRTAAVLMSPPPNLPPILRDVRGAYFHCCHCDQTFAASACGIAFHLPEAQAFWRQHPRIKIMRDTETVFEGREAVAVAIQSPVDNARLEIILDGETFTPLHIE